MLSKTNQKKIYSILNNIYQSHCNKEDVNFYTKEVVELLNKFNQKNKKKTKNISEKTSMLICYGDSIFSQNQKHSIKVFKNFFQKRLSKNFDTIHFLPFYPSSSDSGFAVKDHYKVESKLGNWLDIKNVSKSSDVMADMVINHSSARGLWFRNFLKKKGAWKRLFFNSRC